MEKYKHYINGKWVDSAIQGENIVVNDPATEEAIGEISCAVKDDVDLAVEAAKKSYESRILVDMLPMERANLMRKIADELRKVSKEGGKLLCLENGKLLAAAEYEFIDAAKFFHNREDPLDIFSYQLPNHYNENGYKILAEYVNKSIFN